MGGSAAAYLDELAERTVGSAGNIGHLPQRLLAGRTQDNGSGGVAEEHAGGAVREVGAAAQRFAGHEQDDGFRMQRKSGTGKFQAVHETGTGGIEVHAHHTAHTAGRSGDAELACDDAGSAGAEMLGSAGGDEKMRHVFRGESGFLQCGESGFHTEIGAIGILVEDMALLDAGAGGYPLVGGLHHFLEVSIGEHTGRNGRAETADVAGMIHRTARMSTPAAVAAGTFF